MRHNETVVIARGGEGGMGNAVYSAAHRRSPKVGRKTEKESISENEDGG